jgi:ubiquinone/menaquinone biosynthesis C-methylase UbiE
VSAQVNFDIVARPYRWMEHMTFGPWLQRCRLTQLAHLSGADRVLLLGDGDGRFLAQLLAAYPALKVDVVDSSAAMLRLLSRRVRHDCSETNICLHHANALEWTPSGSYDLIVSHFFLDCFFSRDLDRLFDRVLPHARSGARWVISEFAIPRKIIAGHAARGIIALLYRTFGLLTGLPVRVLPDYAASLQRRGLVLTRERRYLAGLLCSQIWSLPTTGGK